MSIITRNVIKEALKGKGKWMPKDMAYGDRTQANWKRQEKEQNVADPLEIVIGLMGMSDNNIILDHICETQGGVFIKNEDGGQRSKTAMVGLSTVLKEITDVFTAGSDLIDEDGRITSTRKVESLKKEAKEAVQAIAAFISDIESQKFL